MKRFISLLMVVMMCFVALMPTNVFAEGETATYDISGNSCVIVGEEFALDVTLTTSVAANSLMLKDFTYDDTVLEFLGYGEKMTNGVALPTWNTEGETPVLKKISLGLTSGVKFDNTKLCTLRFKVLKEGTTTVSAAGTTKYDSTVFATNVNGGKVVAYETMPETATYTIAGKTGVIGSEIALDVTLTTSAAANSLMLKDFTYDNTVLEFLGYGEKMTNGVALPTWNTEGETPALKKISLGLTSGVKFDNTKLCTLRFKVLKEGTTTVSAAGTTKYDSDVFVTSVVSATVIGTTEVVDDTATWAGVSVDSINYGANIETAVTLPTSGSIKIDGVDYNGTYSVKEAGTQPDAGTAKATVVFTIDFNGTTRTFEKEYDVTVNQVGHDVAGIKLNKTEYIYTGSAVALDIYDSENVTAKSYATKAGEALDAAPSEVGEYKVTLEKAATTNNAATTNVVDFKIVAAAATISTTAAEVSKSWTAYEAKDYTTVAAIKEAMNLPAEVSVAYGESTGVAAITWADAAESYNAKEATYTFVGTPADANLTFGGATLTATATVTKSEVEFSPVLAPITIKKSVLETATEAQVGLASELTITGEGISEPFAPTWSKDLAALKALNIDDKETVEITNVPAWATFGDGATKYTITVTDKDPVNVTVTQAGATYGTEIAAYELALVDAGYGVPTEYAEVVKYTGTTLAGDAYNSEVAPKEAGSYTVTVTVSNDLYKGEGSAEFAIAPLEIAYTVSNVEKKYSLANPEFAGELVSALAYDDVEADLGLEFVCADTKEFAAGQTAEISVTMANKNYTFGESGLTKGTLTVVKMPLSEVEGLTVAISGEAAVGEVLEAVVSDAVAQTEYTYQWIYPTDLEMIADATEKYYTPVIADSNKDIAVYILAVENGNYEDTSLDSETVTVAKYIISGVLSATATLGEDGILNTDDTVVVDYSGVEEIEALTAAGATYDVVWTVGEETVEAETLTITEEMTGVVSVTVTATGNFEGSLSAIVGEIGKKPLKGTITLTKEGKVVTAEAVLPEDATYELVWYVGDEEVEVEGSSYTTTKEDLGKSIVVKAIATGDVYSGEVVSNEISIPAEAPSELEVTVDSMLTNATITMSAFDGGSAITKFVVTVGEEVYEVVADEEGAYVLEVSELEIGTTYAISVVAVNEVGESEAWTGEVTPIGSSSSKPSRPATGGSGSGSGSGTGTTPSTEANVSTKDETVTVPSTQLKDKESVNVEFELSDEVSVTLNTDIKDKGANSVVATVKPVEAEVSGAAAEGIIGEPIEVSVVVTDKAKEEIEAESKLTVEVGEEAYVYAVDANGNTVRVESVYNAETGVIEVGAVENGTVLVISKKAPAKFEDVIGRWSDAEVHKASDLGLVNGKSEGLFDPAGKLTRHENNKLQMNLANALKVAFEKNEAIKIDTLDSHWAYASDLWAAQTGITNGVGTTADGAISINGTANITRQDYMTAIARMVSAILGEVAIEGEAVAFVDAAEIADYAKDAIELLSTLGIVNGSEAEGGLAIAPKANITREEAAAILNRVYSAITALTK